MRAVMVVLMYSPSWNGWWRLYSLLLRAKGDSHLPGTDNNCSLRFFTENLSGILALYSIPVSNILFSVSDICWLQACGLRRQRSRNVPVHGSEFPLHAQLPWVLRMAIASESPRVEESLSVCAIAPDCWPGLLQFECQGSLCNCSKNNPGFQQNDRSCRHLPAIL